MQKMLLIRYSNTFYMMEVKIASKTIYTSCLGWHKAQQGLSLFLAPDKELTALTVSL